jgi:hypothetical protein
MRAHLPTVQPGGGRVPGQGLVQGHPRHWTLHVRQLERNFPKTKPRLTKGNNWTDRGLGLFRSGAWFLLDLFRNGAWFLLDLFKVKVF